MRVVITAGGTGGHIYPALAIIDKIKKEEPNSEFLYIGTTTRMEKDIIPTKNIPYFGIEMIGFNREEKLKNIKALKLLIKNIFIVRKKLKKFKPDAVIGFGGYVTVPVLYASAKLKIKTYIHEQNSIPGKANLFLSKYAEKVFISFEDSRKYFKKENTLFTGNPSGAAAIAKYPLKKEDFGLDINKKLVLIVMGSLGSSKVSELLISNFDKVDPSYEVLFVTGKSNYEDIKKLDLPKNIFIVPYIDDIVRMMKNADLMVTRAGATTLSEIIALKKPSIIIPSPYVPDNHQFINATSLSSKDAAILMPEENIDSLFDVVNVLINDSKRLDKMVSNLEALSANDTNEIIYNSIKN